MAQTSSPAKAAAPKTLSLGGSGAGTGPMLTREELRSCLNRRETLAARRAEIETARAPLDAEKAALLQAQEALKTERAKVDGVRQSIDEMNQRFKAHADRVAAFNDRNKALAELAPPAREREIRALEQERAALEQARQTLEGERAALAASVEQTVEAYKVRASALDQQVNDWNQRNGVLADRATVVNAERDAWAGECADRRYREEDELAIRRGQ
jgi:chromosome segregation ATPase